MTRKIQIINLFDREDRLQLINNQLIQQKIEGCFWPGIKDPNKPERGIARAHKQIVKYAKELSLTSVTIAEDDVKFTAPGAFDYFLAHEPEVYDLYLGGIYHGNINPDNTVYDFAGLMLYTIHHRFYDAFLLAKEKTALDRELAGKGRFIVCDPFVAVQYNGYSDNKNKNVNYDCCLQNRKLFSNPGPASRL